MFVMSTSGGGTKRGRDPLMSHHLIKIDEIRVNAEIYASPSRQEAANRRMVREKSEPTAT